ncbi:MAG: TolC family protein [Candidatus Kapaibacterium sp.]
MIRYLIISAVVFFSIINNSLSVEYNFTLEECIEFAKNKSPEAVIAKNNYLNNLYSYESFKAGYLPQLSLSGSGPGIFRAIDQITLDDGSIIYTQQNRSTASMDMSISQRIALTGGEFFISSGISRIDIWGSRDDLFYRATPMQISLSQPLFRHNDMGWQHKIRDLRNLNSKKKFTESIEDLSINITDAFFNLYISEMNLANARFNVEINDTLLALSQGRYSVGKIAENDLLQSELAATQSRIELERSEMNFAEAREQLKISLGMNNDDVINIIPETEAEFPAINVDIAINKALENNSTITDQNISKVEAERNLQQARSNNNFTASLTASFGLNQSAGNLPEAYRELLDQERLDLTFMVPLYTWGKGSAEIDAALANEEVVRTENEINRDQFILNVKYQVLRFNQLQKQVIIAAKADTIAKKRFELARKRYMVGKIDLNSLFIAQRERDKAFQSYIQTLRSLKVAYYRLRRLTLFDFREERNIEHPVPGRF